MELFIFIVLDIKAVNLPSNKSLPFDCCQRVTHSFPVLGKASAAPLPTQLQICLSQTIHRAETKQHNFTLRLEISFLCLIFLSKSEIFQIKLPFFFLQCDLPPLTTHLSKPDNFESPAVSKMVTKSFCFYLLNTSRVLPHLLIPTAANLDGACFIS